MSVNVREEDPIPEWVVDALSEVLSKPIALTRRGPDLLIDNEEWTYGQVRAVARALGCAEIDFEPFDVGGYTSDDLEVWSGALPEGGPVELEDSGCPSCGYGSRLVVRGVLGQVEP